MRYRPEQFELDPTHPLVKGAMFLGLGRGPGSRREWDDSRRGNHATLTNPYEELEFNWDWSRTLRRWCLGLNNVTFPTYNHAAADTIVHNIGAGDFTMAAWACPKWLPFDVRSGLMTNGSAAPSLQIKPGYDYHPCLVWEPNTYLCNTPATTDVWQHIAAVRRDGVLSLYRNGILDASPTSVGTSMANAEFRIGTGEYVYRVLYGRIADPIFSAQALDWAMPALADPSNVLLEVGGRPLILSPRRRFFPAAAMPPAAGLLPKLQTEGLYVGSTT